MPAETPESRGMLILSPLDRTEGLRASLGERPADAYRRLGGFRDVPVRHRCEVHHVVQMVHKNIPHQLCTTVLDRTG